MKKIIGIAAVLAVLGTNFALAQTTNPPNQGTTASSPEQQRQHLQDSTTPK